jgi:hypothetical protein
MISTVDWYVTSKAAEDRICFYHGTSRATVLAAHHKIVMDLGHSHNWEIAMEYDMQQRELVLLNPTHDLSTLNTAALTIIATCPTPAATMFPPSSPSKRPLPVDAPSPAPKRRQRQCCFPCSATGHMPGNCCASATSHGRPPATIATNTKGKHTLLAPDGRQYCFNWAHASSCPYGGSCSNSHGCSLCGDASHGAGLCSSHA